MTPGCDGEIVRVEFYQDQKIYHVEEKSRTENVHEEELEIEEEEEEEEDVEVEEKSEESYPTKNFKPSVQFIGLLPEEVKRVQLTLKKEVKPLISKEKHPNKIETKTNKNTVKQKQKQKLKWNFQSIAEKLQVLEHKAKEKQSFQDILDEENKESSEKEPISPFLYTAYGKLRLKYLKGQWEQN